MASILGVALVTEIVIHGNETRGVLGGAAKVFESVFGSLWKA